MASGKRILVHIRQHYYVYYCPCGYHRASWDVVYEHQVRRQQSELVGHGECAGDIFEVDKDTYPALTRKIVGLKEPPPFPCAYLLLLGSGHSPGPTSHPLPLRSPLEENLPRRTQRNGLGHGKKESGFPGKKRKEGYTASRNPFHKLPYLTGLKKKIRPGRPPLLGAGSCGHPPST